jgi:hypothetical protein
MARTDVPIVRVNAGTLPELDAAERHTIDIKASSLPARELDRGGRKKLLAGPLRGTITDIFVNYSTNEAAADLGDLTFAFWGRDTHNSFLMGEESGVATDVMECGATTSIMHLGGLDIFYTDRDNSAEWHLTVINADDTTTLTAGVADVSFNFRPEYPA